MIHSFINASSNSFIALMMEAARTSETSVYFNVDYTALHPRRLLNFIIAAVTT
jgi:hypothetical protein